MNRRLIVAIDGPAGSGKSTVAKLVARRLNYLYIDTGAMYRALTFKALRRKVDLNNEEALARLAESTVIDLQEIDGSLKVCLDGEDVSCAIRTPEVTNSVKYVARAKAVRAHMVRLQRVMGREGGVVLEGRDIGTVVFPDADKKFYIDASFDVRVRRRYKELKEIHPDIKEEEVETDLHKRDESDFNRAVGPLKKADDAIFIDTSGLTIEEVADNVLFHIATPR